MLRPASKSPNFFSITSRNAYHSLLTAGLLPLGGVCLSQVRPSSRDAIPFFVWFVERVEGEHAQHGADLSRHGSVTALWPAGTPDTTLRNVKLAGRGSGKICMTSEQQTVESVCQ